MQPGQFVELRIDDTPGVLLRRPISVHDFDKVSNTLALLVQRVGKGTAWLCSRKEGDVINTLLPLGHGFTIPKAETSPFSPLLIGGGVGVAPLYFLGRELNSRGFHPTFLLGARSSKELLCRNLFEAMGTVHVTTEAGDEGVKGFVTQHPVLREGMFNAVYACGPKPMMQAVATMAHAGGVWCEVSLENRMACGLGACLCCVENTREGNVCVCKEGPVFNIDRLKWT